MKIQIIVNEKYDGTRLDGFLAAHYPEYSRSRIAGMVKQGALLVDGQSKKPSFKVKPGQTVTGQITVENEKKTIRPSNADLDILHQDPHIMVINKPAGMVVHPAAGHWEETLVNALLDRCPAIASVGEDPLRPGIVHRLDRDTSGVIVVALNERSFQFLKREFKYRRVKKTYLAFLSGNLESTSGKIILPIGRHPVRRKEMSTVSPNGRYAETHWKVRERHPGADLVEVMLKTGRTHQIRVHFKALGCPLVGDSVYGKKRKGRGKNNAYDWVLKMESKVERQMLHAWQLGFRHPWSGQQVGFSASVPSDMTPFIDSPI